MIGEELMYITAVEYAILTGRDSDECTIARLTIACKLLDSRIGNYPVNDDGYKIRTSDWVVMYNGQYQTLHKSKIDAVQLWVATMVSYLFDNNDTPPSSTNNVKLGRFSVGGNAPSSYSSFPSELGFADSILVSSGIINRRVGVL
jgi:hypothetical protein